MWPVASKQSVTAVTEGFPPLLGPGARVLVLGTLPSRQSLLKHQYYGHPQNAFWRIMGELFGAGPERTYAERSIRLMGAGVAVWDVLASSVRPGSMDSSIDPATATPNDFRSLFATEPQIRLVCFNGQSAAKLFERLVAPTLEKGSNITEYRTLPSTSPAHAAMSFEQKLHRWEIVADAAAKNKGE